MPTAAVRPMRIEDAEAAAVISAEAGERFAAWPEPHIAACALDPPFTVDELAPYVTGGRAWVATEDDAVVGFVIVDLVDGAAHIEEVDVAAAHGRRGHGGRLVAQVLEWASATGLDGVTLTTFRDVPWNAPWYGTHGFRVLTDAELTPELAACREREDAAGLPAALRVVMRHDLGRNLR